MSGTDVAILRGSRHWELMNAALKVWKRVSSSKGLAWLLPILFTAVLSAQQAAPTQNDPRAAGDACLQRSIPVTLLRNPENLELQPTQLQVRIDGVNASILSFQQQNISPRVILLLDSSGSMAGSFGPKWQNALLAAGFVLDAIPLGSPVAFVTFDEQVHVSGFGHPQAIEQKLLAMKNAKPGKRTALYSAVEQSLQLFGTPQFGDAVFITSDGGDNFGPDKRKEVAAELMRRGVRAFAFLVQEPPGSPLTPQERNGPSDLIEFVKSTGGSYISPQISAKWIAGKEDADMGKMLRSQLQTPYRLDIRLAAASSKAAKLKITAADKAFEFSYPQRIEPCAANTMARVP